MIGAYDRPQFGTFDGLDNRKELMALFVALGDGLDELSAGRRRARFIRSILPASVNGFASKSLRVDPCSSPEAYFLFVAVTGVLGVQIDWAVERLQEEVRRGPLQADQMHRVRPAGAVGGPDERLARAEALRWLSLITEQAKQAREET